MKILNSKDFLPLAISGLVFASSSDSLTFTYNEFRQDDIQMKDELTQNHLNSVMKSSYSDLIAKVKFYEHYNKWKEKTRFLSSPNKIIENEDFKGIVDIGRPVVKYILEELQEQPSYLVWALNIIYGFKISNNPSTTIPEASKMWIKYLKA